MTKKEYEKLRDEWYAKAKSLDRNVSTVEPKLNCIDKQRFGLNPKFTQFFLDLDYAMDQLRKVHGDNLIGILFQDRLDEFIMYEYLQGQSAWDIQCTLVEKNDPNLDQIKKPQINKRIKRLLSQLGLSQPHFNF